MPLTGCKSSPGALTLLSVRVDDLLNVICVGSAAFPACLTGAFTSRLCLCDSAATTVGFTAISRKQQSELVQRSGAGSGSDGKAAYIRIRLKFWHVE